MKRFLIISFLIATAVYTADAQLLEDTDRRLKTKKSNVKAFFFLGIRRRQKIVTESLEPITIGDHPGIRALHLHLNFLVPRLHAIHQSKKDKRDTLYVPEHRVELLPLKHGKVLQGILAGIHFEEVVIR